MDDTDEPREGGVSNQAQSIELCANTYFFFIFFTWVCVCVFMCCSYRFMTDIFSTFYNNICCWFKMHWTVWIVSIKFNWLMLWLCGLDQQNTHTQTLWLTHAWHSVFIQTTKLSDCIHGCSEIEVISKLDTHLFLLFLRHRRRRSRRNHSHRILRA